jgi:hypothetical protein
MKQLLDADPVGWLRYVGAEPRGPVQNVDSDLPSAIERMTERVEREATPDEARTFWAGTYFMMGLRYPEAVIRQLVPGVREMRESVTYQSAMREGALEEAKKILVLQGRARFGTPDARTREIIDELSDLEEIEQLAQRLVMVSSWVELFGNSL